MTSGTMDTLRRLTVTPRPRPRLLFGVEDVASLRARAAAHPGMLERVHAHVATLTATPGADVDVLQPYLSGSDGVTVAGAYVLTGDASLVPWLKARLASLLAMDTWLSPVHVDCCRVCDHVMANVGAMVAQMADMLGEALTDDEVGEIAAGVRALLFEPFLAGTTPPAEFWFTPEYMFNWKIMTCGETGLAACAFAEHIPDAGEILARCSQGVLEILDAVPPEGDWPEGVGYWFATLRFGLQFARALQRLTDGAVDLLAHPGLQHTGDFLTLLTTPGGRIYNFSDCSPEFTPAMSEVLALLAAATGRGDWMALARQHPADTPAYLAYANPAVPDAPLPRTVAAFPTTGAASMRAGTTFVGLRAGSPSAAHYHLDANSFVIEAGGVPLVPEYPYWPQAHFLGYFDGKGPRWNFDGLATIGHSTLLVDGRGQVYEPGCDARIIGAGDHGTWARLVAEAGPAYRGLLTQFTRTLLLLKPDVIVIRDVIACEGERYLEWLLQHTGTATSEGRDSFIASDGVRLAVTPFLPDRSMGWRVREVESATTYECSDTRREVTMPIRYRSFSALRPTAAAEFLFGLRVHGTGGGDWRFDTTSEGWTLQAVGYADRIVPDGETLRVVDG